MKLLVALIILTWFLYDIHRSLKQRPKLDLLLEQAVEKLIGEEMPFSIIQSMDRLGTPLDFKAFRFKRTAIIKTLDSRFIQAVIYEGGKHSRVAFISDFEARQLLFKSPSAYRHAFGESPDRQQLARLMSGTNDKLSI